MVECAGAVAVVAVAVPVVPVLVVPVLVVAPVLPVAVVCALVVAAAADVLVAGSGLVTVRIVVDPHPAASNATAITPAPVPFQNTRSA